MHRKRHVSILLVVLHSATALADQPRAAFADQLNLAVTLYEQKRYADAIPAFERAYTIRPLPRLLFNLAQSHRKLGHPEEAVRYFEAYLRTFPTMSAQERGTVQAYIDGQREVISPSPVAPSPPPRADRTPESTLPSLPAQVPANAGPSTGVPAPLPSPATAAMSAPAPLPARVSGSVPAPAASLVVEPGRRVVITRLDPPAQTETVPRAAEATASPGVTAAAGLGLGIGGALLASSIVTGVLALNASTRLREQSSPTRLDYEAQQSRVGTLALAADILIAASAVAITIGVVAAASRRPRVEPVAASLGLEIAPGRVSFRGTF